MNVIDVFDKRVVDLEMDVKNKDEAIRLLSQHLKDAGYIDDVESFVQDIYLRESEGETGIGEGIAIPHGKSDSVTNIGIAVGKCKQPIEWESLDGEPVEVIFLFCVSKSAYGDTQLRMLGDLAARLGRGNTVDLVKEMKSFDDLIAAFSDGSEAESHAEDIEELDDGAIEINIE